MDDYNSDNGVNGDLLALLYCSLPSSLVNSDDNVDIDFDLSALLPCCSL